MTGTSAARGRFADVSEPSGIARVRNRYPMSVVAADFDEDGWVDLYVASDSTAAIHYRNCAAAVAAAAQPR